MISRPTGSDLDVIAEALGWFHLTDDDRGDFVEMADKVLGVIDLVDSAGAMFESANTVIPAHRDAGRRALHTRRTLGGRALPHCGWPLRPNAVVGLPAARRRAPLRPRQ